jgi:hypothetical protein
MSRKSQAAFSLLLSILFLITGLPASSTAAPANTYASANGRFSVELSLAHEEDLLVSILQTTNDTKAFYWSRTIKWDQPDPSWNGLQLHEVKAFVTNDGNTVILRDNHTTSEKNGIRILQKSGTEYATNPFTRRELTGVEFSESSLNASARLHLKPRPGPMRMGISYMHVASILDFISEERNSYALWFGQTDQWFLLSLGDFKEMVVRDAEMIDALNEAAYTRAKELVLEHQPPALRRMFSSIRSRVAEFIPSLSSKPARAHMQPDTVAAYLFIGARRRASDAPLIQGLVHFSQKHIQHGHNRGNEIDLRLNVSSPERLVGDFLWSRWNGLTNLEVLPQKTYQLLPTDTYRHLGSVTFDLKFPYSLFNTNAGRVWVYLSPAEVPPNEWHESSDLLAFLGSLGFHASSQGAKILGGTGTATVHGLTAGDYRAKFIWEPKNQTVMWRTNHLGVHGDFESLLSAPFTIKPGLTTTNISIAITNLVTAPSLPGP